MKRSYKRAVLVILDCIIMSLSLFISFYFLKEYDGHLHVHRYVASLVSVLISFLVVSYVTKIYSVINRFTDDIVSLKIIITNTIAYGVTFFIKYVIFKDVNRRLLFLGYVFSTILIIGLRLVWRLLHAYAPSHSSLKSKKILVVGAGQGAEFFVKTVMKSASDLRVIGLVDLDKNKKNTYLAGKKVLGTRYDIPKIVQEFEVQEVVIAIPSMDGKSREEVIDICNSISVPVFNMPSIEDMLLGGVTSNKLQEIDLVDLLGRNEVELDQSQLSNYFFNKTVLVTGAGGSIGSEICRQVAKFSPQRLVLLGHGENSIYIIHRELSERYGKTIEIIPLIADIQDRELMFSIMADKKPDVVYHAAAHKHVPLMEYNPREAVKNNIFGTKNVAEAAKAADVPKFVMVSTDKAVNPPNVMGATKRVAEMIVTSLNEIGKTQFAAVRFGNVLGSRGSVVHVFKDQIAKGGPVTVTDFAMTRYFMTIPEASRLVIQAGHLSKGGEIFVLDMGEPILIRDLAEKIIKLSGYTTKQISIIESGMRPGEKLYEEPLSTAERVSEQVYEKIFVGKVISKSQKEVMEYISRLGDLTEIEMKQSLIEFAVQK